MSEQDYLKIILDPLAVCTEYLPKLGHGRKTGYSVEEFEKMYGEDPFYYWLGLDSPLVYAAHRMAGGMTSVYRQIGLGCERLFRQILEDKLGLTPEQNSWSYVLPAEVGGKERELALDARIPLGAVSGSARYDTVADWVRRGAAALGVPQESSATLLGAVFEVRQGYKSKDSKRQNADIRNALNAYSESYLPVVVVFSTQIDDDLITRYRRSRILVLTGILGGEDLSSTYAFLKDVVGYDLAGFLQANSDTIRQRMREVFEVLLS